MGRVSTIVQPRQVYVCQNSAAKTTMTAPLRHTVLFREELLSMATRMWKSVRGNVLYNNYYGIKMVLRFTHNRSNNKGQQRQMIVRVAPKRVGGDLVNFETRNTSDSKNVKARRKDDREDECGPSGSTPICLSKDGEH